MDEREDAMQSTNADSRLKVSSSNKRPRAEDIIEPKALFQNDPKKGYVPKISVLHPKDLFNQAMQNLKLISQSLVLHPSKICTNKMLTIHMMILGVSRVPNL